MGMKVSVDTESYIIFNDLFWSEGTSHTFPRSRLQDDSELHLLYLCGTYLVDLR